ncbi:MAG: TRAP transporter small permease, partial [Pseudomonadota bacterium]|nr:TRAP transporter small permease [Pseudomonadota bacterium]
ALGGLALLVMMVHITAEVILRSAFNITIPGTLELVSFYYMVFAVFAGLALVALLNEQVIVEVFTTWMPRRALLVIDGLAALLGAAYAGLLVYGGWLEAGSAMKFNEMVAVHGFDVPIWPSRWIAVVGLALVTLSALGHGIALLRGKPEPDV